MARGKKEVAWEFIKWWTRGSDRYGRELEALLE